MTPCLECGAPAEHEHHVIPKALGGSATVPLCAACHGKVHGADITRPALIREGMRRAKERGVAFGRPAVGGGNGKHHTVTPAQEREIFRLARDGRPKAEIAREVGVSRPTVSAILKSEPASLRRRQVAGIAAAKARGVRFGRPATGRGKRHTVKPEQEAAVRRMKGEGEKVAAIARATGLSRPTVYSILGEVTGP